MNEGTKNASSRKHLTIFQQFRQRYKFKTPGTKDPQDLFQCLHRLRAIAAMIVEQDDIPVAGVFYNPPGNFRGSGIGIIPWVPSRCPENYPVAPVANRPQHRRIIKSIGRPEVERAATGGLHNQFFRPFQLA